MDSLQQIRYIRPHSKLLLVNSMLRLLFLSFLLYNKDAAESFIVGMSTRHRVSATIAMVSNQGEDNNIFVRDPTATTNRREAILRVQQQAAAVALATTLMSPSAFAEEEEEIIKNTTSHTIIMTGANSGIGLEACKRLAVTRPDTTILLACRSLEKAQIAMNNIQATTTEAIAATLLPCECDLADLSSIESFVQQLKETKNSGTVSSIDTVCYNAGLARNAGATDCVRTRDGWEMTAGVNFVGHFYLQHLLLPLLSPQARIVVTASGVHDPASPGGAQGMTATLGELEGLREEGRNCEMIDGGLFNGDKAYKDSKLCNVLFTQELQRRLASQEATREMSVNCYNPGLIVSTGLFRDQNPLFTKLFDFAATDLLKVGESPAWGGGCLEYMTTLETKGLYYSSAPGSSKYGDAAYGKQFCPATVSVEAQDQAKAKRLWELTSKALGIKV